MTAPLSKAQMDERRDAASRTSWINTDAYLALDAAARKAFDALEQIADLNLDEYLHHPNCGKGRVTDCGVCALEKAVAIAQAALSSGWSAPVERAEED
jgi:hypothetical protein